MFNPIDMMQMQGAPGLQALSQQFGVTPEQTVRALQALLPAFAIGMQRNADPTGLAQFFGMAPKPSGPDAMAGLFGSPVLAQAVIQQAASASGVGSQVLRQMLPMMAGMIVASIVHMVLNQSPQPAAEKPPAAAPGFFPPNPVWDEMMRAFAPGQAAAKAPEKPKPAPERKAESGSRDMLQQMLQTGAEVQEQNVKAMQGIFDAFWTERGKTAPSAPTGTDSVAPDDAGANAKVPAGRPGRGSRTKPA